MIANVVPFLLRPQRQTHAETHGRVADEVGAEFLEKILLVVLNRTDAETANAVDRQPTGHVSKTVLDTVRRQTLVIK